MNKYNSIGKPLECKCGCKQFIRKNIEYCDNNIQAEYSIHCKDCGQYLAYFAYGNYEYEGD